MVTLILNCMEGPVQLILARPAPAQNNQPDADGALAIVDAVCWEPEGQGAETLVPNLSDLLKKNKLTTAHIGRIACVRGPGSFTGIRLALTTALGLSRSISASPTLAGLDYLPLLAATMEEKIVTSCPNSTRGSIWVLTHARRGQVHIQGFEIKTKLSPLNNAEGCMVETAVETIRSHCKPDNPVYLCGSGLVRNLEQFSTALPKATILEDQIYPSLEVLAQAAGLAEYSRKPVEPLYLRASDAEENLPYIAAGLGLDPHQAMLDLLKLTGRSQ